MGGAEIAVKEITDRIDTIDWYMITHTTDKTLSSVERIGAIEVHRLKGPKFLFPLHALWYGEKLQKTHNFSIVWGMMATYAGFAATMFKMSFPSVKFLLSLQEGDPLSVMKRKALPVYPLFLHMFKVADMIQAISHFLASYAKDMGHKKDVVVIPNGVDMSVFTVAPKQEEVEKITQSLRLHNDVLYIVTTSRLVKKNGVDLLIQSLTYMPTSIHLLVIGTGPDEDHLRSLARNLGVRDRVIFVGFVSQQDMPKFFAVSSIFCRPSRSEGFGNSFIEAMAFGLPVIATPVGGIVDFIDDRETGLFCAPENPKSIADAVKVLLTNDALREHMIKQAKERVYYRYTMDRVATDMNEQVFNKLLSI